MASSERSETPLMAASRCSNELSRRSSRKLQSGLPPSLSDGKLPGELLLVPLQRVDGISDDAGAIAGAGPVIADGALLNSCDSLQTEGGRPGGGCAD